MNELSFEEQDLIIDKLIEKYQAVSASTTLIGLFGVHLNNNDVDVVWLNKSRTHWKYKDALIELDGENFELSYTIGYLQQKYFQDVLTPTQNELIMFELTEGFEWPLQSKFLKKD